VEPDPPPSPLSRRLKTIIKLVITGLLVHAAWRTGTAFWKYYMFKDGVQAAAQFAGTGSPAEIQNRVIEIAKELEVPLDPEKLAVRREMNHTLVDAVYTESIELVPTYFYPWEFTVNVDAFTIDPYLGQ
jgi:type III secretion system FlhB-like substrate exporter